MELILIITLFLLALTASTALAQAPEGEEYIVQADDWLSKIAEKEYGDVLAYPAIVEATNAKAAEDESVAMIDDPNVIEVGQKLWLPNEVDTAAIAEAPAPAATAADLGYEEAWQSASCSTFELPPNVAAISNCGYVTVPEFHGQPDGNTIELAVVVTKSTGDNPAPDPLFIEQGGPGGSTIGVFPPAVLLIPTLTALLDSRDLVFVEQRGTQYSRPNLACPEMDLVNLEEFQGLTDEDDLSGVQACRDRLANEGVNFEAYNSVENAADMYFVADVLGYEQFNYYGVSYGTLLGQYVIQQSDENPDQLRSVIIDAVVAPNVDFNSLSGSTGSHALRNLFATCAADETCNQQFPDLENEFLSLVDTLNDEPIDLTVDVPEELKEIAPDAPDTIETTLTGEDFVDEVFQKLYGTDSALGLPRDIYNSAQNGDFEWVEQSLSQHLKPSLSARGMYFAVLCARTDTFEDIDFFDPPYEQLAQNNDDELFFRSCDIFGVGQEIGYTEDTLDVPTLVLNGTFDPITPQPYGEYVGSLLPISYVFTFSGTGHGAMTTSVDCVRQIAIDFLETPSEAPDGSCVGDVAPNFLGNITPVAELTLEERTLDNGITVALPSQWALNPTQGLYMDPNNPTSISNGAAQVQVLAGQSLDEALTTFRDGGAEELASDQTFGAYTWTILEQSNPTATLRYALADVPEANGTVSILLAATPDSYDDVIATLWEPILSSVSVGAAE